MLEGTIVWSAFAFFGLVIIITGPRLSRYGDAIAEKTGLESSWIGIILLALVTSLPEVATSSTAAILKLPDVVFGNVFGSNLFNVLIIGILDIASPRPALLERARRNNLLISSFGIKMMAVALLPLVLYNLPGLNIVPVTLFGMVDLSSIIIILFYIIGMRMIFQQESVNDDKKPSNQELKYASISSRKTFISFSFLAVIIVGSGIFMSILADKISNYEIPVDGGIPIGQSLVGIILLAVVTSLPELMVSYGAVKIGAVDMAVGNVLGSNMFNMLIIGIADFFYSTGSILSRPTVEGAARVTGLSSNLLVGLCGIVMLAVISSKLSFRFKRGNRISFSTPVLFAIFLVCYVILFYLNFG